MNLDALTGRVLDAAIARQVFGHQVEERPNPRTGELDAVYNAGLDATNPTLVRVPFYSVSFATSVQVELELHKRGWKREDSPAGTSRDTPPVVLKHSDGRTVEASGRFEEALCRAGLKAVVQ